MWQNILGFFEVLLLSICLDAFKPRIKEGKLIDKDDIRDNFPHFVAIGYPYHQPPRVHVACGASAISLSYVLTAAHCMVDRNKSCQSQESIDGVTYYAYGGLFDSMVLADQNVQRRRAQWIHHQEFCDNPRDFEGFDIGVGKLETEFTQNEWLRPTDSVYGVELSNPQFWTAAERPGQFYWMAGMGRELKKDQDVHRLRRVLRLGRGPKQLRDVCHGHGVFLTSRPLFSYPLEGDSGSPIVAKHSGPDGFTVYPLFLLFTKGIEDLPYVCTHEPQVIVETGTAFGLVVADFRDWIKSKTNIELQLNFKLEASRSSPLLQKVLRRDRMIAKLLLLYFF